MALLSIHVLGPFQAKLAGESVAGFATDKVRALLVYLALSPDRPHRREALAGLLWPEFPERSARTNLRNALANLRQVIGDGTASPPFLHSTRQTIQFNGQSDYWLDADAFEGLLATVSPGCEELEQAVSLVRGPFLEGFSLADAAPFEEWLLLRREHVWRRVDGALDSLAAIYEGQGALEQALTHARRRVELEPWEESGQRQLMRLLAQSGHRSQALAQYENLCRSLGEELGAGPSAETQALSEAILLGELAPAPDLLLGSPVPVWNLPSSPTPFFGRTEELATLEAMLAEADARLVTLTGMGGSGKTRLALEAGSRLAERERQALAEQSPLTFPHGIAFAPLAALDSIEGLAPALAETLRLRLEGGQEQLLEFLRRKQILLILDNLEQLLDGVELLSELLRTAPGVKILATSRERLQMQGEHVISLGGLPYPVQESECSLAQAADLDACLAASPALQLLLDGIRRIRPDFVPDSVDLPAMLEVCRMVDGLPLALELAASWADALSLDDILLEARRSLDFLRVDWPDLPPRHRSLYGVFDVSWQRLSPAEQATFSSLTVFRGGLIQEAARQVVTEADAMPRLLAALVRKSFLQYDSARDRYGIHELLRQYGAEKLAQEPAREAEARDRHSAHYVDAVQQWEAGLLGSRQQTTLREMEIESENIRAAWTWAVEQAQVERLGRAMEGLERFYWLSGRFRQAEVAFQAAASTCADCAARNNGAKATCLHVWLRALICQSEFLRALGQRDAARRCQQQCLAILDDSALAGIDTRLERGKLAQTMGATDCMADYEQGRQRFEVAYYLYRELDYQWGMASALNAWSAMSMFLGDLPGAKPRAEEALAIFRALGDLAGAARSLRRLAQIAWLEGRLEEAEPLAREAYASSLRAGAPAEAAIGLLVLGETLETRSKFSEAHSIARKSLALLSDLGYREYANQAHGPLGSIAMHRGRYKEARDHAERGLSLAREEGPRHSVGHNLLVLGCLDLAEGMHDIAHRVLNEGVAVYQDIEQRNELSQALAILALADFECKDTRATQQHLSDSFQLATELGVPSPFLWALPAMALLLAGQYENERAVELYALAMRYPFVAKSRWFDDVVGQKIAAVAATLPAERVAVLEERGRARDLKATAAELLTELRR
jgi:DNA-binding SARP family transcriptional activator/predicted ATPase